MVPLLEIKNITKRYSSVVALDDVSIRIYPHDFVALIGPNGAGKSTVINSVTGATNIEIGSIHLYERDITKISPYKRARMGLSRTFQITSIFPNLSVIDNLRCAQSVGSGKYLSVWDYKNRSKDSESKDLLDRLGLYKKRNETAGELSHGDKRILEFAMSLSTRPKLLLMDEPMQGLGGMRMEAMGKIQELSNHFNVAVLFTEHDMDIVFSYANRVLVMNHGRVVASGGPDEIKNSPLVASIYLKDYSKVD